MTFKLPEPYLRTMQQMLGTAYDAFLASYDQSRVFGLRINSGKIKLHFEQMERIRQQFRLTSVPWCDTGYYYEEETRPGRHPYHAAGVYYIQEPSAMSAVELLRPEPGDIVLDLAAAPGGKSTQIADKLQGQGLLISNEIHPARAQILSENIERMGIRNAVVTNAAPDRLAERFPAFFDRIMVDAPCSGEGMFRKEPDTISEWSEEQVTVCATRQMDILQDAVKMLKPGGTLGYSTCTFNQEENERIIEKLVLQYPQLSVQKMERFWPHERNGEGHFVAILKHSGEEFARETGEPVYDKREIVQEARRAGNQKNKRKKGNPSASAKNIEAAVQLFREFADHYLQQYSLSEGEPVQFGEQLYMLPALGGMFREEMLQGIRTLRPGWHLGTVRKNRFEPSHALALGIKSEQTRFVRNLTADSSEIAAYLRGETLVAEQDNGWTLVTVDGFPLGWAKANGGMLKNHYPKGLRRPN